MRCLNCNTEVADNSNFCLECGCKLEKKRCCSNCGIELPDSAKFCPECGTPCQTNAVVTESSKGALTVTFDQLNNKLAKGYELQSIDDVVLDNYDVATANVIDNKNVIINPIGEGEVKFKVLFTFTNQHQDLAGAWGGLLLINAECNVELQKEGFMDADEDFIDEVDEIDEEDEDYEIDEYEDEEVDEDNESIDGKEMLSGYEKNYSEKGFWDKVIDVASKAGEKIIYIALLLYYTATASSTPTKAKVIIWSALGYFILPLDLVPDFIPVLGFTDDLAALVACYKAVNDNITPEIEQQAKDKVNELFDDVDDDELVVY